MGTLGKVPGRQMAAWMECVSNPPGLCMSGAALFSLCRIATERLIERRGERSCFVKEKGTVKWFNGAKGYGFIQLTTGEDVFVHFSAIQENGYRTLNEGETVEFELLKGPKGFSAANVLRGAAN
jgi:CspA family cold shock protein